MLLKDLILLSCMFFVDVLPQVRLELGSQITKRTGIVSLLQVEDAHVSPPNVDGLEDLAVADVTFVNRHSWQSLNLGWLGLLKHVLFRIVLAPVVGVPSVPLGLAVDLCHVTLDFRDGEAVKAANEANLDGRIVTHAVLSLHVLGHGVAVVSLEAAQLALVHLAQAVLSGLVLTDDTLLHVDATNVTDDLDLGTVTIEPLLLEVVSFLHRADGVGVVFNPDVTLDLLHPIKALMTVCTFIAGPATVDAHVHLFVADEKGGLVQGDHVLVHLLVRHCLETILARLSLLAMGFKFGWTRKGGVAGVAPEGVVQLQGLVITLAADYGMTVPHVIPVHFVSVKEFVTRFALRYNVVLLNHMHFHFFMT